MMGRSLLYCLLAACLLGRPGDARSDPLPDDSLRSKMTPMISAVLADGNGDGRADRIGDTVVVSGRVTARPGRIGNPSSNVAVIQDGTYGIALLLPEGPPVERGDSLLVRGRLSTQDGLVQIDVSQYRVATVTPRTPTPIPLTVATAAGEYYEGWLARVRGQVVAKSRNAEGRYLVLRDPGGGSSARLLVPIGDRHLDRFRIGRFETGDEIAVTGVIRQSGNWYEIEPRERADIRRVGQAWEYLRSALLGLGVVALFAVLWIVVLRRAVDRRTRQLEEAKRESDKSRELFESVFENAPVMIALMDGQNRLERVNKQFENILGWREETLVGRDDVWEHLNPDDAARAEVLEFISRAPGERIEASLQTMSGKQIVVEWWAVELTEDRRLCLGMDVTDRKKRERELRRKERRYQAVLNDPNVLSGLLDTEGRLLEANPTALSYVAPNREELLGQRFWTTPWYKDPDRDAVREYVERAAEGEYVEYEHDTQIPSGERRTMSTTMRPVTNRNGEVVSIVVSSRDITERKRREKELRHAKERAEAARQEAEEASRAKSSLLANMSHEIRTPLTSVIGFAEAIGEDKSRADRFAPLIEKSGKRLLQTLDGVLNLSKLEAEQMELSEEAVGLATEAERTAEELRPEASEKGVDLELQTEPARATADEGGIQIVLRNLLSNAIKYTGEGGRIWVRTYREEDAARSENAAVLEVEDTGIGMEPEVAEDLFEPFRQASEGFGREYEGTGVGLAVTKKAAEQMGGTIEVETEEGEGSRFVVRLPQAGDTGSGEAD